MDLHALTDFHLVVAHGGIGRASRATGRPKASLSRRIMALEESLGVRLLDRGSRSLRLTDEGSTLHLRTKGLLCEIAEAGEAVRGLLHPRGRLRVCSPVVFAHTFLGRVSALFAAAFPEVSLDVVADDRPVDPVEGDFDLVIRVNPVLDERLIGRIVSRDQLVVVAPTSMPRPAPPADPSASVPLRVVATPCYVAITWEISDGQGGIRLRPDPILHLSSMLMARDAVLAGAGAAVLPRSMTAGDVASGRMACWGEVSGGGVEIWILHSAGRLTSSKVEAFVNFLCTWFARPDS